MHTTEKNWTSRTALGLSILALGTSLWAGCRSESAPQAEPATPVTAPQAAAAAEETPSPAEAPEAVAKKATPAPEAKAAPSQAPVIAEKAEGAPLTIRRLIVAGGVEQREPVIADAFHADGTPVFAFLELRNDAEEEQKVVVTFEHPSGARVGNVSLAIPATTTRYRTWAKTALIRKTGEWVAVVRSPEGTELARSAFTVAG